MKDLISQYSRLLQELLSQSDHSGELGLSFDDHLSIKVPADKLGVYRIFERGAGWQESVYVGQTKKRSLEQRLVQHRDRPASGGAKLKGWLEASGRCKDGVKYLKDHCRF